MNKSVNQDENTFYECYETLMELTYKSKDTYMGVIHDEKSDPIIVFTLYNGDLVTFWKGTEIDKYKEIADELYDIYERDFKDE